MTLQAPLTWATLKRVFAGTSETEYVQVQFLVSSPIIQDTMDFIGTLTEESTFKEWRNLQEVIYLATQPCSLVDHTREFLASQFIVVYGGIPQVRKALLALITSTLPVAIAAMRVAYPYRIFDHQVRHTIFTETSFLRSCTPSVVIQEYIAGVVAELSDEDLNEFFWNPFIDDVFRYVESTPANHSDASLYHAIILKIYEKKPGFIIKSHINEEPDESGSFSSWNQPFIDAFQQHHFKDYREFMNIMYAWVDAESKKMNKN
jgi:hypothetical protein